MRLVIALSIVLGLIWNVAAVTLMGGRLAEAFTPAWLLAGACSGVAGGLFTIWSRQRRDGEESFVYGVANYFIGIFVYWLTFLILQRIILCIQHGGWTDFDLRDHLMLIVIFLSYGTLLYGIVLIPLNFLSRFILWKTYLRASA